MRRSGCLPVRPCLPNFNPRTHEGCDLDIIEPSEHDLISIHAPTRGATVKHDAAVFAAAISIHAPTRGATVLKSTDWPQIQNFNPRTHEGCDILLEKLCKVSNGFQSTHPRGVRRAVRGRSSSARAISIHAPTRGATRREDSQHHSPRYFNPRTHEGCDGASIQTMGQFRKFQSTHPRGVRQWSCDTSVAAVIFQSTHPRGVRRRRSAKDGRYHDISIHAPTRGAT